MFYVLVMAMRSIPAKYGKDGGECVERQQCANGKEGARW
jgi:hypothetical protein